MLTLLQDLYQHQEWADRNHWSAIEALPAALDDEEIRKRLYHIHLTQHAFYCITSGKSFVYKRFEEFPDLASLKNFAGDTHAGFRSLMMRLSPAVLDEILAIPWFKEPPLSISRQNALLQAVYHSQYHRGQNASRIRVLGGEPPMTDYIAWLWKGRPKPES